MVGWLCLAIIIIFINSFLLGKVYKRFTKFISSYATILFGVITFFGIFTIILIVLFLFNISFAIILYIMLIFQIILIGIYIFNWRYLFISFAFNWKNILIVLGIFCILLITFFITRDYYNTQFTWFNQNDINFVNYYHNLFKDGTDPNEIMIFKFGTNNLTNNFSYLFFTIFSYIFNINDNFLLIFHNVLNFIIYFTILSLIIVNMIDINNQTSFRHICISMIFTFLIGIISFSFSQYMWIIIFLFGLISFHMYKENEINLTLNIIAINFIVLSGCCFNINFIVCALVINIIQLFISYKQRKPKATDYNVLMMFSTFIFISVLFNNSQYVSYILIISIFIIYTFYFFYKSSNLATRVNDSIDQFLYKKINIVIIAFIAIIFIISIAFFISINNFKINTKPWLLVTNLNQLEINSTIHYYLLNAFFWVINGLIFLFSLFKNNIIRLSKKQSKFSIAENDVPLFVIFIFWNPISTNLFSLLDNVDFIYLNINLQVIFFCALIPLLLSSYKKCLNEPQKISINISYLTIITITSGILIAGANLG